MKTAESTADVTEARTGPRSPIVRFKANFDYTWPSRSVTAFKAGWQGRVKGEVAEAAEAAGVLESAVED